MATATPDERPYREETGVYADTGLTVLPKRVREKLGGVEKGDNIYWYHEDDGSITVTKEDGEN